MGKKEPSKGREWERGRRDVLNQTFQKLREALPNHPRDAILSKKTILTEALAYIHHLEQEKQEQCGSNQDLLELQTWVRDILQRQAQLLSLLKNTGISLPAHLLSLQHPPKWVEKFNPALFSQIQHQGDAKTDEKHKHSSKEASKKRKIVEKTKENHASHKNSKVSTTSCSLIANKSSPKSKFQDNDPRCKKETTPTTCVPLVQNGPMMVQASSIQLPSQLLFTSATSNSSLSTSLPLLVSVAGVKPVNPVILVQSNGMTPSPLASQNAQNPFVSPLTARPIRPGLQTKTPGKVKKIAIPPLRSRTMGCVINNDSKMKFKKRIKVMSITPKKNSKHLNIIDQCKKSQVRDNGIKKMKTAPDGMNSNQKFGAACRNREISLHLHDISNSKTDEFACTLPAQKMANGDQSCSDTKNPKTTEIPPSAANTNSGEIVENGGLLSGTETSDSFKENANVVLSTKTAETSSPGQITNNRKPEEKSKPISQETNASSVSNKHHAASEMEDNATIGKHTKTVKNRNSEILHDNGSVIEGNTSQECEESTSTSPSKASKSNYSILALCSHQQQLFQHSHLPEQSNLTIQDKPQDHQQDMQEGGQQSQPQSVQQQQLSSIQSPLLENIPRNQQENMLQQESGSVQQQENVQQQQPEENVQQQRQENIQQQQEHIEQDQRSEQGLLVTSDVQNVEKVPDISLPSTEQFLEWTEKSRMKPDRTYPSYSPFSNAMVHNSKNTFVPINDMDNYKTMPEVFDTAEGSFSLPLHSSDISGDIFASLQVPSGGQHPESISPTAAFLLAFPLVSTSKASELLSDEAVCENSDSQPGMKTILQIGNLDSDTPVTKCVSVFSNSVIDNNTTVFSASHFPQDRSSALTSKGKHVSSNSSENMNNFIEKNNEIMSMQNKPSSAVTQKDGPNFTDKNSVRHYSSKGEVNIDLHKALPPTFTSKSNHHSQNSSDEKSLHCHSGNATDPTMIELHSALQGGNGETKDKTVRKSHSGSCVTMSASTATSKAPGATSIVACDKRSEWPSVLNTTQVLQNPFSDFPVLNSSQPDCALNLPTLSMLTSSSNAIQKCAQSSNNNVSAPVSSCASIVSWSTLPPVDSAQAVKSGMKLTNFESLDKSSLLPSMSHYTYLPPTTSASTSHHSTVYAGEDKVVTSSALTHMLIASKPAMNFVNHKLPEPKLSTQGGQFSTSNKHNMPMATYKSAELKKQFDSSTEIKQNSLNQEFTQPPQTSKQIVPTSGIQHYTHRSSELKSVVNQTSSTSSSSSSSMYGHRSSSEFKHKPGSLNYNHSHIGESKQGTSLPIYNQSVHVSGKLYNQGTAISNLKTTYNLKPIVAQNTSLSSYSHDSSLEVKAPNSSVHYSQTTQTTSESKKTPSHCSQNQNSVTPHTTGKENTILSHYTANNVPVPQYNLSSGDAHGHQHKHHEQSLTLQHTQQSQEHHHHHHLHNQQQQSQQHEQLQENQFLQTNNKEPTTNLHRPPVNWMTAPDIRSHQHHNGPAFGNSGTSVCSTQGMLYLPDHMKDGDTAPSASIFDSAGNFHCLEMTHSGQTIYKSNELQIFGTDAMENLNENNSWSPNKGSNSAMLANMLIPSTLPTLVGDLALGDNNLSRQFLPGLANDHSCPKKSMRRSSHTSKRGDKGTEEIGGAQNIESTGSFLSVSQLVESNTSKNRSSSSLKDNGSCYPASFSEQDSSLCQTVSKHNNSKPVSSNYSTEALLSTSSVQQNTQHSFRKRRAPGSVHYPNNYVAAGAVPDLTPFHTTSNNSVQPQTSQTQCSFLSTEYQGTFLHSDTVHPFVLPAPTRGSHRNVPYAQNVIDRNSNDENLASRRTLPSSGVEEQPAPNQARQRTASSTSSNATSTNSIVPSSSNIMDFGYINMTPAMLSEDLNFANHHPPPPPFLPHHSYSVSTPQDSLYSAPRLAMHPHHTHHQNSNIHSPSATTLTNFHLSTIFPEINDKVLC